MHLRYEGVTESEKEEQTLGEKTIKQHVYEGQTIAIDFAFNPLKIVSKTEPKKISTRKKI